MRTMPDAFHRIPDRFKTQSMCEKAIKEDLLPRNLFLTGLLEESGCGCGMMTIMMMMVIIGIMMMKINFLRGMMAIKNGRLKKPQ